MKFIKTLIYPKKANECITFHLLFITIRLLSQHFIARDVSLTVACYDTFFQRFSVGNHAIILALASSSFKSGFAFNIG